MIAYIKEAIPAFDVMQKIAVASPENLAAETENAAKLVEGNSNLVVEGFVPNVANARKRELETLARLAMLKAAVAYRQNGVGGLQSVRDPYGDGPFESHRVERGLELRSKLSQFGLNGSLVFAEKENSR